MPIATTLLFEGVKFASASGTGKVTLGSYAFTAQMQVTARGEATLTATESQSLPGIGSTQLTLAYENGRLSATGTLTVSLGSIAFDNTTITIDRSGKISLAKTSSVDLPGLGSTELTLVYAGNRVSATGTRQVKLGSFAFDDTAIAVSSTGAITVSRQANLSLPVIGSTRMTLGYANGVLSASGSRTVSLGSFAFSNAAVTLDSSGNLGITKTQSLNIPGIGGTQMTLAIADGVLAASGSRSVTLGSYGFSNVAIRLDSAGGVSVSKAQSLSLSGIGSTQMTLGYANGRLSAIGSRTVSLGSFAFDNTAITIDSAGILAVQKQQSVTLPGIGSTQMSLAFVNGAFVATGSRTVSLGNFAFDNAEFSIDSDGNLSAIKSQGINLPVIGNTQMTLAYVNGTLSAAGSRTVSLSSYDFSNATITLDSAGTLSISKTQDVNIPRVGSVQMALGYRDGVLSASGTHDVTLGNFLFSSADISISSTGAVSISDTQNVTLPVIGTTQLTLSYANGALAASGSRSVSLGSFLFSDAAIALDSAGTLSITKAQSVSIPCRRSAVGARLPERRAIGLRHTRRHSRLLPVLECRHLNLQQRLGIGQQDAGRRPAGHRQHADDAELRGWRPGGVGLPFGEPREFPVLRCRNLAEQQRSDHDEQAAVGQYRRHRQRQHGPRLCQPRGDGERHRLDRRQRTGQEHQLRQRRGPHLQFGTGQRLRIAGRQHRLRPLQRLDQLREWQHQGGLLVRQEVPP
ncbi:MAG: hypothetical protein IPK28_10320 [Devosia sp.]|nr:hypothetical protein [Devosia sp.]